MIFPRIPKKENPQEKPLEVKEPQIRDISDVEVMEHLQNFKSTENMVHVLGMKDVNVSALHVFLEKNPSLREYLQKKKDSEINKNIAEAVSHLKKSMAKP